MERTNVIGSSQRSRNLPPYAQSGRSLGGFPVESQSLLSGSRFRSHYSETESSDACSTLEEFEVTSVLVGNALSEKTIDEIAAQLIDETGNLDTLLESEGFLSAIAWLEQFPDQKHRWDLLQDFAKRLSTKLGTYADDKIENDVCQKLSHILTLCREIECHLSESGCVSGKEEKFSAQILSSFCDGIKMAVENCVIELTHSLLDSSWGNPEALWHNSLIGEKKSLSEAYFDRNRDIVGLIEALFLTIQRHDQNSTDSKDRPGNVGVWFVEKAKQEWSQLSFMDLLLLRCHLQHDLPQRIYGELEIEEELEIASEQLSCQLIKVAEVCMNNKRLLKDRLLMQACPRYLEAVYPDLFDNTVSIEDIIFSKETESFSLAVSNYDQTYTKRRFILMQLERIHKAECARSEAADGRNSTQNSAFAKWLKPIDTSKWDDHQRDHFALLQLFMIGQYMSDYYESSQEASPESLQAVVTLLTGPLSAKLSRREGNLLDLHTLQYFELHEYDLYIRENLAKYRADAFAYLDRFLTKFLDFLQCIEMRGPLSPEEAASMHAYIKMSLIFVGHDLFIADHHESIEHRELLITWHRIGKLLCNDGAARGRLLDEIKATFGKDETNIELAKKFALMAITQYQKKKTEQLNKKVAEAFQHFGD